MSKKTKKTAPKPITPTGPKTPIQIAGQTYFLSFEMDDLSDAEEFFNRQGANINLLRALSSLSLKALRQVFPCAIHTYHPTLTFAEAQKLLTIQASYEIAAHVVSIWSPAPSEPAEAVAP